MKNERDWNDPRYKAWRLAVYKRDKFTCRMLHCKKKGFKHKIQAHHIKKWSEHPDLRFEVSNGITLCQSCHKKIEGQEESYEQLFTNILSSKENTFFDIRRILYTKENQNQQE